MQFISNIIDGQITDNFNLTEVRCKGSGDLLINQDVLAHAKRLQEFREWYNRPMPVNSWYRSEAHNKAVGGAINSQHLLGVATDIALPPDFYWMKKDRQEQFIKNCREKWFALGGRGFGIYNTFMHFDSRKTGTWDADKR